jgi:hypothetical protein
MTSTNLASEKHKYLYDKANEILFDYDISSPREQSKYLDLLIKYGWDINTKYQYNNDAHQDITPLMSVCEWRIDSWIKTLLEHKADPNCEIQWNNHTPSSLVRSFSRIQSCTDTVLWGHNPDYTNNWQECETTLKLLIKYGMKPSVSSWTLDAMGEMMDTYLKESQFIRDMIRELQPEWLDKYEERDEERDDQKEEDEKLDDEDVDTKQ